MARAHAITILAAIAGGTALWLLLALPREQAPPGEPDQGKAPAPTRERAPDQPARTALPREPAPAPAPGAAPAPAAPGPGPEAPGPAAAPATVQVLVFDLQSKAAIAAFRWRFRGATPGPDAAAGAPPPKGEGRDGRADLALPPGSRGALLVEADGYAPERVDVAVPQPLAEPVRIETFLGRRPALAGVVLEAVDDEGWPVRRLRLDVWQLAADAPEPAPGTDPGAGLLWSRTGTSEDGRFALPALPAGRFLLRAQPTDDAGAALPLLPWRHTFAFAGYENLPFQVAFAPGIALVLAAGGEGGQQDYTAVVRDQTGAEVPVLWRSVSDGAAIVQRNRVRLPQRATALLALPPGDYRLELRAGDREVPTARTVAGRVWTFTADLGR